MRRRNAAALAAGLLAAGIVSGAASCAPLPLSEPAPLVETLPPEWAYALTDSGPGGSGAAPEYDAVTRVRLSRLRALLQRFPLVAGTAVCLPFWGAGITLSGIGSAFLLALAAVTAFAASMWAAFPDRTWRQIFYRRNLSPLVWALLCLTAFRLARTAALLRPVWRPCALVLIAFACAGSIRRERARIRMEERTLSRRDVERIAWRLSDTVCPRR